MNPICKNDRTLIVWGFVNPKLVVHRNRSSFNLKLCSPWEVFIQLFHSRRVLLTNSSASGCFNSFMLPPSSPIHVIQINVKFHFCSLVLLPFVEKKKRTTIDVPWISRLVMAKNKNTRLHPRTYVIIKKESTKQKLNLCRYRRCIVLCVERYFSLCT